jgi:hypothetical protein
VGKFKLLRKLTNLGKGINIEISLNETIAKKLVENTTKKELVFANEPNNSGT